MRTHDVLIPESAGAPLVSVVIPAYNVSRFVAATLDSVFAQRFGDYEVIVVNDGSTDTAALEAALAPYRDRIIYLTQPNAGPSAARNAGIVRARGRYVAFLDGDDVWLEDYLLDQVGRISADPSLAVVYANVVFFGGGPGDGRKLMELSPSSGEPDFASLVTLRCSLATSATMVRRDRCLDAGLFDPALHRSEDYDLWLRIAHAGGRFAYTTRVLARYRQHGSGLSSNPFRMIDAAAAVLDKCERTLELTERDHRALRRQRAALHAERRYYEGKQAFAAGDFQTAREALADFNAVRGSRKMSLIVAILRYLPRPLAMSYTLLARLRLASLRLRRAVSRSGGF